MAYGLGVGVDTNSFDGGPTDWTPAIEEYGQTGRVRVAQAAGIGLVLIDTDGGTEWRRREEFASWVTVAATGEGRWPTGDWPETAYSVRGTKASSTSAQEWCGEARR